MRPRAFLSALVALACLPLVLAGCGIGRATVPPTLAAATKPFDRVTIVDWLNTTDAVRLDYLTDALAAYPNCPLTARGIEGSLRNRYTAEPPTADTPRTLFLEAVAGAGCRPSGVVGPRTPTP